MKTLIFSLSLLLLTSIFSCAKKYDGCCIYTINFTGSTNKGTPPIVHNDCFTQVPASKANDWLDKYQAARQYAIGQTSGQPYEQTITGPGCNFTHINE